MISRLVALLVSCAACTGLNGRAPAPDASDAATSDAVVSEVALDTRPVAIDAGDLPLTPCARGDLASVDPMRRAAYSTATAGMTFTEVATRMAFADRAGRIVALGSCAGCAAGQAPGTHAGAWRFDGDTLALDRGFGIAGLALDRSADPVTEWLAGTTVSAGRSMLAGHRTLGVRSEPVVARLDDDGSFDETFGAGGRVTLSVGESASRLVPFAIQADADGVFVVISDALAFERPATRAWVVRLDAAGTPDATFGDRGVLAIDGVHGCYDVERDGGDYVLACVSPRARPELVRVDRTGRRGRWPSGDRAENTTVLPRFFARSLSRDTAGRWIVAGAVSQRFDDSSASPAVVRFLPDGTPDLAYGQGGMALVPGPRHVYTYSFSSSALLGCEDRLLVGANYNQNGVVVPLDRHGRLIEDIGDYGTILLPAQAGTFSAVLSGIVALPGTSDVVAVSTHLPPMITLHRIRL
ncbi:MAG: hypothetical protein Q8S73_01490 [Deltaproteobacteria bacterium]|nr:hypothetical protein [Myxococcales bacterium]MDP3212748.1 hypothetical protein [Deltaproteobacteria bacterium]